MVEILSILLSPDGLVLALVIFSSGVGIGASVVQINSIVNRKASDAATSIITWMLLFAFSLATTYYLWRATENIVLPLLISTLAASSVASLVVSFAARQRLAEVESDRRCLSPAELLPPDAVLRASLLLRERVRAARSRHAPG